MQPLCYRRCHRPNHPCNRGLSARATGRQTRGNDVLRIRRPKEAAYPVDYFRHSPKNLNVASINNHITAEYAGVTTSGSGMAVAMNTGVNANFAFCPFRMEYSRGSGELSIRANPFGTYHGRQILPPTRGNRQGFETVTALRASAPQRRSHIQRI